MNRLALFIVALTLLPGTAVFADDAAAMQDSLAPPACKKPVLPSAVRKADDSSDFDAKYEAWDDCVKAYLATQNALAQKHIDAANAAVADANAFRDRVNESRNAK